MVRKIVNSYSVGGWEGLPIFIVHWVGWRAYNFVCWSDERVHQVFKSCSLCLLSVPELIALEET